MAAASRATPGPARYALLGSPVAHSLSPAMQRAAFVAAGIDARYDAFDVPAEALEGILARLHGEGYEGLNLTAPLKERVLPLLVGTTKEAARVGSVNTLLREGGGWRGDATDGEGFLAWAREARLPVPGAAVALLGAGGAARAVAPSLAALGARSVIIAARDMRRAAAIADPQAGKGATTWAARELGVSAPEEPIAVLVRALSVPGCLPAEEAWWQSVAEDGVIVDLNYASLAAATRAAAARSGRRFEDGRGMLLHQGALAFTRWTGRPAPLDAMRRALVAEA